MIFSANTIEKVSRILAEEITGSKITNMLQNLHLNESPETAFYSVTKWKRLDYAIIDSQNTSQSGEALINVIEYVMDPVNFLGDSRSRFQNTMREINAIISFNGLELTPEGKVRSIPKASSFDEAYEKAASLHKDLLAFQIHPQVLSFCRPEILQENYFHMILEASKSLLVELRALSHLNSDGNKLVNECFDGKNPLIVMNRLQNDDEWSEHKGLQTLLNTIVYLYRNPKAHNPKVFSADSREDAITAMLLISKARYMLEGCALNTSRAPIT